MSSERWFSEIVLDTGSLTHACCDYLLPSAVRLYQGRSDVGELTNVDWLARKLPSLCVGSPFSLFPLGCEVSLSAGRAVVLPSG